jgi:D-tyrosyl-tRNA(Tyr) deacylase
MGREVAGARRPWDATAVRAVVQRVSRAEVRVEGRVVGAIGRGLLVLLGVAQGDGDDAARLLADKIAALRIFEDADGKMNRSVTDLGGAVLVVSQFTLLGDARKGNRPSFTSAAPPDSAQALYERCCTMLRERGLSVATGVFRAHMEVESVNEGPVTILLDSARLF